MLVQALSLVLAVHYYNSLVSISSLILSIKESNAIAPSSPFFLLLTETSFSSASFSPTISRKGALSLRASRILYPIFSAL